MRRHKKHIGFPPIIRAVACLLILTFSFQSIVWAYPDKLSGKSSQNTKLSPQSFFADNESVERTYGKIIEHIIEGNGIPRDRLMLDAVKAALNKHKNEPWFVSSIGYVEGEHEITISFSSGYIIRYFDPTELSLADQNKYLRQMENTANLPRSVTLNRFLHKQLLQTKALPAPEPSSMIASDDGTETDNVAWKSVLFRGEVPDGQVREDEAFDTQISDFAIKMRPILGKGGGIIEDMLDELWINIMEHGKGGSIIVVLEGLKSGDTRLRIIARDNGEGLPGTPDELIRASILAKEKQRKDIKSGDLTTTVRGQGFSRIALDPDSETIEYNGKRFIRISKDPLALSWFRESGPSDVVRGTRIDMEFSLAFRIEDIFKPDSPGMASKEAGFALTLKNIIRSFALRTVTTIRQWFDRLISRVAQSMAIFRKKPEPPSMEGAGERADPLTDAIISDLKNKLTVLVAHCDLTISRGEGDADDRVVADITLMKEFADLFNKLRNSASDYFNGKCDIGKTIKTLNDNLPSLTQLTRAIAARIKDGGYAWNKEAYEKAETIVAQSEFLLIPLAQAAVSWLDRAMNATDVEDMLREVVGFAKKNKILDEDALVEIGVTDDVRKAAGLFTYKLILKLAVEELLLNATKYSNSKKIAVTVSFRAPGELRIDVLSPTGISPENIGKIFKPGFAKETDIHRGTEYGLPNLREAIESVGGSMWVKSTLDHGAVFSFTLPVNAPIDMVARPVLSAPVVVAVSGLGGSGRRTISQWIAAKMGLCYINRGLLARTAIYEMIKTKQWEVAIDPNDEAAATSFVENFFRSGRLDHNGTVLTMDGIDLTKANSVSGLTLEDRIKADIDMSEENTALLHKVFEYPEVKKALDALVESMAGHIKASGKYNGIVMRVTDPVLDPGVINVMLNAPADVRSLRAKTEVGRIEELDTDTGNADITLQFPNIKKMDTTRIKRHTVEEAFRYIVSQIPSERDRGLINDYLEGWSASPKQPIQMEIALAINYLNNKNFIELPREKLVLADSTTVRTFTVIGSFGKDSFGGPSHLNLAVEEDTQDLYVIKRLITEEMEDHCGMVQRVMDMVGDHEGIYKARFMNAGPGKWAGLEDAQAIVYPYVRGRDMAFHMAQYKDRPLSEYARELFDIVIQSSEICEFLEEKGVPNLWDIKPENIIITSDKKPVFVDYTQMNIDYPMKQIEFLLYASFGDVYVQKIEGILPGLQFVADPALNQRIIDRLTVVHENINARKYTRVKELTDDLKEIRALLDVEASAIERMKLEDPSMADLPSATPVNDRGAVPALGLDDSAILDEEFLSWSKEESDEWNGKDDGEDRTNPVIRRHIDAGRAIEIDDKERKIVRIRRDRSNPRDPPLEAKFESNGIFKKMQNARDRSLLLKTLQDKPNFHSFTPDEQEKLVLIAQKISLSVVLGRAFITAGSINTYTHIRMGFIKHTPPLKHTVWIGEELLSKLNPEQIAQVLLEESQHIVRPYKFVNGRWQNLHWKKGVSEDPRTTVKHDKDFMALLKAIALGKPQAPSMEKSAETQEPVRVLVVDGNPTTLRTIARILKRHALTEVVEAGSGEEAMSIFKERGPFDIVFTDSMMPGMNGHQLSREIKSVSPRTYIVMGSAMTAEDVAKDLDNGTINSYFNKADFNFNMLRSVFYAARDSVMADRASDAGRKPESPIMGSLTAISEGAVAATIRDKGRFSFNGIRYTLLGESPQDKGGTVYLSPLVRGDWSKGFEVYHKGRVIGTCDPSTGSFTPAEMVRRVEGRGRFNFSWKGYKRSLFPLGAQYADSEILLMPRDDDWAKGFVVFHNGDAIAAYDAPNDVFGVASIVRYPDEKGRFGHANERYSLGAGYAAGSDAKEVTLKPYEGIDWNSGFRVYHGGSEIASHNKLAGVMEGMRIVDAREEKSGKPEDSSMSSAAAGKPESPDMASLSGDKLKAESVYKDYFESLFEFNLKLFVLLAKRMKAKRLSDAAELEKAKAETQGVLAELKDEMARFDERLTRLPKDLRMAQSHKQAIEKFAAAEQLIGQGNEPAANAALVAALNLVSKAREDILRRRISSPRVRINLFKKDGKIVMRQQAYIKADANAKTLVPAYIEKAFDLRWQAGRSLDDQEDSILDERQKIMEYLAKLKQDQAAAYSGLVLTADNINYILPNLYGVHVEEKRLARIALAAAKELFDIGQTDSVKHLLPIARRYLELRVEDTERILHYLKAGRIEPFREIVTEDNADLVGRAKWTDRLLEQGRYRQARGNTYGLMKVARAYTMEPDLEGFQTVLGPVLGHTLKLAKGGMSADEEKAEKARAEFWAGLARKKLEDSQRLGQFMEVFRTEYARRRISAPAPYLKEDTFIDVFESFVKDKQLIRGSPQTRSFQMLCYLAAFISMEDPVFAPINTLRFMVEIDDIETILKVRRLQNFSQTLDALKAMKDKARISDLKLEETKQLLKALAKGEDTEDTPTTGARRFELDEAGRFKLAQAFAPSKKFLRRSLSPEELAEFSFRKFAEECRADLSAIRSYIEKEDMAGATRYVDRVFASIERNFSSDNLKEFKSLVRDVMAGSGLATIKASIYKPVVDKVAFTEYLDDTEKMLLEFEKLTAAGRLLEAEKTWVRSGRLDASKVLAKPGRAGHRVDIRKVAIAGKEIPVVLNEEIDPDLLAPQKVIMPNAEESAAVIAAGEEALKDGAVGFITVAGGMSSRAGIDHPKGMHPIMPLSEKTLFEARADELRAAGKKYGKPVMWFIMTSDITDTATREYFIRNDYFGLGKDNVIFFKQDSVPAFISGTQDVAMRDAATVFTAPNGHGGLYKAIRDPASRTDGKNESAIDEAKRRGIETFLFSNVDNPMPVIDRLLLGYHVRNGSEFTTVLVRKTASSESLGLLAEDTVTGKKFVVEYNQPAAEVLRELPGFELGSINRLVFSRDLLESVEPPPYHRIARKKAMVSMGDKKAEHLIDKFESFVFEVQEKTKKAINVYRDRGLSYAPFKSLEGSDSPQAVAKTMSDMNKEWIRGSGRSVTVSNESMLEISPAFATSPAEAAKKIGDGFEVKGNSAVYFGGSSIRIGKNVSIDNAKIYIEFEDPYSGSFEIPDDTTIAPGADVNILVRKGEKTVYDTRAGPITLQEIRAILDELSEKDRSNFFDEVDRDAIAQKILGMGLRRGATALVVGPRGTDYLPLVLSKLGIKAAMIDTHSGAIFGQKLIHRRYGMEKAIESFESYEDMKGRTFDNIFMLAVLHTAVEPTVDRMAREFWITRDRSSDPEEIRKIEMEADGYFTRKIGELMKPILEALNPDGGYLFVNDISPYSAEDCLKANPVKVGFNQRQLQYLDEALDDVEKRSDIVFSKQPINIDDFSMHAGNETEPRRSVVYKTERKAPPAKPLVSEDAQKLAALHELFRSGIDGKEVNDGTRILLSENLFLAKDGDSVALEQIKVALGSLLKSGHIAIMKPDEIRRAAINRDVTKEKMAIVFTKEDFENKEIWSGSDKETSLRSSVLILDDKMTGNNYLYLEGVIGLARAVMTQNRQAIREYYRLISGVAIDDQILQLLKDDDQNNVAFAIKAILRFKPISMIVDSEEFNKMRISMENALISA